MDGFKVYRSVYSSKSVKYVGVADLSIPKKIRDKFSLGHLDFAILGSNVSFQTFLKHKKVQEIFKRGHSGNIIWNTVKQGNYCILLP